MTQKLATDQENRITATLKRIREGLARTSNDQFCEPCHIFDPEAQDGTKK